jgi:pre-mRNA-processing factor SLU7
MVKASGDVKKFNEINYYAWTALERGQGINLVANPSEAELKYREHKEVKQVSSEKQKEELLARYGGREHLENPDKYLLGSQSESFVVYAPDGSVVRGKKDKMAIPRSKYEEDVLINNHTSVWGSFWENGQWGYACCQSSIKNSYCVGAAGIQIKEQMMEEMKSRTAQKLTNVSESVLIGLYLLLCRISRNWLKRKKKARKKRRNLNMKEKRKKKKE